MQSNHDNHRRSFLGTVGKAASVAAGALSALAPASAKAAVNEHNESMTPASPPPGITDSRIIQSFDIRMLAASQQSLLPVPPHTTNGDEFRYPDKIGTYTKCVLQKAPGLVDMNAYQSFRKALNSGSFQDFENVILGGARTLNGPEGAYAFDMEGADSRQFGNAASPANQSNDVLVPPAPPLASAWYGAELVELYWGSLLRDIAFTDYPNNPIANMAAQELTGMPYYAGPRDPSGNVTPELLMRGTFPGETIGPYVSQFMLIPTAFGSQPISQQWITYQSNLDYMTDPVTWFEVQNGIDTGLLNVNDPQLRYAYKGRSLATYTHVDVLYQAYFVAFLTMLTAGVPLNPGNPYVQSKTQNGFATLGGPDIAATIGEIATRALKAVWYQKWPVHLRHRPESGGGIVNIIKTGQGHTLSGKVNDNVLNSVAVQQSYNQYQSYLLSCAFPEGSPAHPAYPTGHGTVGGACITILKFFMDGSFVLPNPIVSSNDGLTLVPYTGSDAGQITVNGELNKLAHNVTYGHGILSGVHWRSDSDQSMLLGEAVALSVLRDKVLTYKEKFTVNITKLDGTIATISNQ